MAQTCLMSEHKWLVCGMCSCRWGLYAIVWITYKRGCTSCPFSVVLGLSRASWSESGQDCCCFGGTVQARWVLFHMRYSFIQDEDSGQTPCHIWTSCNPTPDPDSMQCDIRTREARKERVHLRLPLDFPFLPSVSLPPSPSSSL